MYHTHAPCQISLTDFAKIGFPLPENHRLVKLADAIPWDSLIAEVSKLFAAKGRNSKSTRMMLGLELAKTFYKASDEEIVSMLTTDIAVMYFCGFASPLSVNVPDPSSLTKFRNRLDSKTLSQINELGAEIVVRKLAPRKRTQVASDTTCLPANITYPTDTKLLTKVVVKLDKEIKELRSKGHHLINRGKETIINTVNKFNKKRIKTKTEIRKVKRQLITQAKRSLRLIRNYRRELSAKGKAVVAVAQQILSQQIRMYKEKNSRVKNRIVSFQENQLRPIYRGKQQSPTEFGKKVGIMIIGQRVILPTQTSYENFSDSKVVTSDLEQFQKTFRRNPKEYSADRGMHSPTNHKLLKKIGCKDGIQYRGKIPKGQGEEKKLSQRLYNNRSCAEGKIGTLKTKYGMGRISYKSENTEVRFQLGILLSNFNWYVSG